MLSAVRLVLSGGVYVPPLLLQERGNGAGATPMPVPSATLHALSPSQDSLEERLRLLRQEEQALQQQQQHTLRLSEICANIETFCQATRTGLHALDFAGRRRIVELLVDRVLISHETVEIRYAIPLTGLGYHDKKGSLQLPYRSELLPG